MVKKALIIGISYSGSINELHGTVNDANYWYKTMNEKFGYQKENIKLLTDNILSTKKNIIDNLNWLVQNAKQGDILFFSFSGHGIQKSDKNNDEIDGYDEAIVCSDYFTNKDGIILDDELYTIFSTLPSDVTLTCIFDCCHSGTITDITNVKIYDAANTPLEQNKIITKDSNDNILIVNRGLVSSINELISTGENIVNNLNKISNIGQQIANNINKAAFKANMFIFSACRDNQTALDVAGRGMLSSCLEYAITTVGVNSNYLTLFQKAAKKCNDMRILPRFQPPKKPCDQVFQLVYTLHSDPLSSYF